MSNKLVLAVAGDQLAVDMLGADVGNILAKATGTAVKVIRIGDDAEMAQKIQRWSYAKRVGSSHEGGDPEITWWGPQKTAAYYKGKLATYASKVASELPDGEWTPAVWWFLGLSDAHLIAEAGTDETAYLNDLRSDLTDLLTWNPFGAGQSAKSYIALVPAYPEYSPGMQMGVVIYNTSSLREGPINKLNTAISGAVSDSSGAGVSIAVPSSITGWDDGGLRQVEEEKDYGLSAAGASAYAEAFATATAAALNMSPSGDQHPVTETKTEIQYTTVSRAVERNKLAGLEGRTVTVLVDGVVYEGLTVSANGTLNLPQGVSGDKITVGIPYTSVLAPLPLETDAKEGSTLGKFRAYGKCEVRVFRSAEGATYGASRPGDLYNVDAWKSIERYDIPFPQEVPNGLYSGDIEFTLPSGQDPDTTIWLVMDQPLPFRLISFMAEVDFGQV